jgi:hypothetical protein
MGVRVTGLDELIRDLESIPRRAPAKLRKVIERGGVQIKLDWKRRWSPVGAAPHHLPHVTRGIGYDVDITRGGMLIRVYVGVHRNNPQAPLAHFAEFGSINNAPLPGGLPALRTEEPKFVAAVGDAGVELLLEGDGPT